MLEPNRHQSFFENTQIDQSSNIDSVKAVSARVLAVHGISLVHANGRGSEELAAALEILRGFRATGRRVVLCNTSMLTPGRQNGRSLVEKGGAQAVVSCGVHGRDLAIGARDAGLDLASVVVCPDVKAACEALVNPYFGESIRKRATAWCIGSTNTFQRVLKTRVWPPERLVQSKGIF